MTHDAIRNDAAEVIEVQRWDAGSLPAPTWEPTQQEGLRAPARFARSGVLEYRGEDGTVRREWIPPEELFDPESMASLRDAPIVVYRHPTTGRVTPDNYSRLNVGHVSGEPGQDGAFLSGFAVIQEKQAVEDALGKALTEFSTGCLMRLDMTPGVVPEGYPDAGEPYDCVQRRRRYNHVAFLPPGAGRAGPEVTLRLDSKGNQLGPTETPPITQQDSIMELTDEEKAGLKALIAMAPKLQALVEKAEAPAAPPAAPAMAADAEKPEEPAAPAAAPTTPPATPPEDQPRADAKDKSESKPEVSPEEQERIRNDAAFSVARDLTRAQSVLKPEEVQKLGTHRQVMEATCLRVDSKFTLGGKTPDKMNDTELRMAFDAALREYSVRNDSETDLAEARRLQQVRTDAQDQTPGAVESALNKKSQEAYAS